MSPPSDALGDYLAHVRAETEKTGELPPVAEREAVKTFIRETAKRHKEAAVVETKPTESPEAKAGKERLNELVERGDLSLITMERLAIYWDCEPWQVLQKAEKKPSLLSRLIEFNHQNENAVSEATSTRGKMDARFANILKKQDLIEGFGFNQQYTSEGTLLESFRHKGGYYEGHSFDVPLRPNFPVTSTTDLDRFLTKEQVAQGPAHEARTRDGYIRHQLNATEFLRRDYWTVGRVLATELPEEFGYDNSKEADQMITAEAEKVGRIFELDLKKQGDGFYIGPKTPFQEKLRGLDVKEAQALVAEYRQGEKAKLEKNKQANDAIRKKLLRLIDIDQLLPANLPALRNDASVLARGKAWLARTMSSEVNSTYEKEAGRISTLIKERNEIIMGLHSENRKLAEQGFVSDFADAPIIDLVVSDENHAAIPSPTLLKYWTQKAHDTVEQITKPELLRGGILEQTSK